MSWRWIFWAVCFLLRAVLIVAGWVLPLHINYKTSQTKGLNIWERYVENSWRNPTPYLRGLFKQPVPEVHPNPDAIVRLPAGLSPMEWLNKKSVRVMTHGPYIEYWSLRWRDYRYWEFRIGWKFVDGDDTFWPTLQIGPRK